MPETVPLPERRDHPQHRWVPAEFVWDLIAASQADPGLAGELHDVDRFLADDLRLRRTS